MSLSAVTSIVTGFRKDHSKAHEVGIKTKKLTEKVSDSNGDCSTEYLYSKELRYQKDFYLYFKESKYQKVLRGRGQYWDDVDTLGLEVAFTGSPDILAIEPAWTLFLGPTAVL